MVTYKHKRQFGCLLATIRKPHFAFMLSKKKKKKSFISFCICNWESDNQNGPIPSHTVNPVSVFWQAVLCKQRCFLELSCRIFIVWLRFQWEIMTSVGGIGAARQGGDFPLFPQTSAVWAWSTHWKTACERVLMDCSSLADSLSNSTPIKKKCLLLKAIVIFFVKSCIVVRVVKPLKHH